MTSPQILGSSQSMLRGFWLRITQYGALRYLMSFVMLVVLSTCLSIYYRSAISTFALVLHTGITYCLLAIGASLVMATSEIDLSSLGVATLSGVVFAVVSSTEPSHPSFWGQIFVFLAASMSALLFCSLSGFLVSVCVLRFHAPAMLITWAIGNVYVILAILLASYAPSSEEHSVASVSVPWHIEGNWNLGGHVCFGSVLLIGLILASLHLLKLPLHAAAVGGNENSARYAGILKSQVLTRCFIANALIGGIAGIFQSLDYGSALTKDLDVSVNGLTPIAIALIGGTSLAGGYISLWSVVFAAFFWAAARLLGPLVLAHLSAIEPLQAETNQIVFYILFITISLLFGKALTAGAAKIYSKEGK